MKKAKGLVFILCSVGILLSSCGGGGGGSAPTSVPAAGTVDGYVYMSLGAGREATGAPTGYAPLAGAAVSVTGASDTTTTDANGYYKIAGVPVGSRTVTISKSGYETIQRAVTVESGKTVRATQEGDASSAAGATEAGSLTVTSIPPGAAIVLDGITTPYVTPHTFEGVKKGSHTIGISMNGFKAGASTAAVEKNQTAEAQIFLAADLTAGSDANDDFLEGTVEPIEPAAYQESNVVTASEGEELYMSLSDYSTALQSCTASDAYSEFLDQIVYMYNNAVLGHPRFEGYVSMTSSLQTQSANDISSDAINVFECYQGPGAAGGIQGLNAAAYFRTVYLYDYLMNAIFETSLLLATDISSDEFQFLLPYIAALNSEGYFLTFIDEETYNQILADDSLSAAAVLFALAGMSYVAYHEIGHSNLGHTIQKTRAINQYDPSDQAAVSQILFQTALNQPFEHQADIFSGNALMSLSDDALLQTIEILGGMLVLELLNGFDDPTYNSWSMSHPPSAERIYTLETILNGDSLVELLQPIYNAPEFARVAARQSLSDRPLPKLPPYAELAARRRVH